MHIAERVDIYPAGPNPWARTPRNTFIWLNRYRQRVEDSGVNVAEYLEILNRDAVLSARVPLSLAERYYQTPEEMFHPLSHWHNYLELVSASLLIGHLPQGTERLVKQAHDVASLKAWDTPSDIARTRELHMLAYDKIEEVFDGTKLFTQSYRRDVAKIADLQRETRFIY